MSSSGRHILAAYACIMRHTRHCHGSRGKYPVLGKIMLAGSSATLILTDISSMRHLHVASQNLFSLLNFADLSCDCEEFSAAKGLRSARWIWSRDLDQEAGWLSGIFTSLFLGRQYFHPNIQLHKKNQICWFSLFIHHITVWEYCWAGITYVSFVWIALLKRAEMN